MNLQGVSWHQHKHILAFISGPNQVTIRDYDDAGKSFIMLSVLLTQLSVFEYLAQFVCHFSEEGKWQYLISRGLMNKQGVIVEA